MARPHCTEGETEARGRLVTPPLSLGLGGWMGRAGGWMGRVGGWMGQGVSATQPHRGASRRGVPMWVPDAFLHLWLPPWAPGQGFGVCRPLLSPPHPQDALGAISPPLDDPCPGLAPASGPWVLPSRGCIFPGAPCPRGRGMRGTRPRAPCLLLPGHLPAKNRPGLAGPPPAAGDVGSPPASHLPPAR